VFGFSGTAIFHWQSEALAPESAFLRYHDAAFGKRFFDR